MVDRRKDLFTGPRRSFRADNGEWMGGRQPANLPHEMVPAMLKRFGSLD